MPPFVKSNFQEPQFLLPFIGRFVEKNSPCRVRAVELVRDGSMRFRLDWQGKALVFLWIEHPRGQAGEISHRGITVTVEAQRRIRPDKSGLSTQAALHLAGRLSRLLRNNPPLLLQWRNRNPLQLVWGKKLFQSLCPGLLVAGQTSYFQYVLASIDEYLGFINLTFQSPRRRVRLRLAPSPAEQERKKIVHSWGNISLMLLEDQRSSKERKNPRHRVEEFVGYLLSRNIPPRYDLRFERDEPPAADLPAAEAEVEFLRTKRLDDSAFFEMLLANEEDIAVLCSCPQECFNLFSLVGTPKEDWSTGAPWRMQPAADFYRHFFYAPLTTRAAILGDDAVENGLRSLARAENTPELFILFDSCLHRLIGDDVQGKLSRYRAKLKAPLVYYDIRTTQHPYLQQLRDFWKNLHREMARPDPPPEPQRLCFIGLGPELEPLLARALSALGLKNGGCLFPLLSLTAVKEFAGHGLVVANCWNFVRLMFSDMLKEAQRPVLWLPLPYGLEGTQAWLGAICRQMRRRCQPSLDDLPELKRVREEFENQRRHLQGQRVGIIDRLAGSEQRWSPRVRFGVPVLNFLHELGLGLDVNLYVSPADQPPPAAELARGLGLELEENDSLRFFEHPSELHRLLSAGEFAFVYTEKFRDQRIVEAGKIPLPLSSLRSGYGGALASAKFIKGMLQTPFYRRRSPATPSIGEKRGKKGVAEA